MHRKTAFLLLVALVAGLSGPGPGPSPARAEGDDDRASSVAAANGVVVHGVDRKLLAARIRETDAKMVAGDVVAAAVALAELSTADTPILLEEGEGVWVAAGEAVLQRIAKLPPDALARYRSILDARASSSLTAAAASRDVPGLSRDALRYAFTTPGARMLLLLADLRLARGEIALACRTLEDLLRLLPEHAPPDVLAAAASRLGALLATGGDGPGIRGLVADLAPAVLEQPSPLGGEGTLRDELARGAALADRRSPLEAGPEGPLSLVAEMPTSLRGQGTPSNGRPPGTLRDRPLPIGTADAPVLLTRSRRNQRQVPHAVAVAPEPADPALPEDPRRIPGFRVLWQFPSSTAEEGMPGASYPFSPVRLTADLVAFTWPLPPAIAAERGSAFSETGEEQHELVVLSISAEGKLVEERGVYEAQRDDGDETLEQLSFCGAPAVDGSGVYATAVRRAADGDSTELHVCRFDLDPGARDGRLRLRWRQHVLDGRSMPPARFPSRTRDVIVPITLPSPPLVRAGRVFVASNTGAVACLDATTGRPEWVETYDRFGPATRTTVRESELATWDDVPLFADGPYVFAAPSDAESLVQFRRAPRGALSVRVDDFVFAGPNGTSRRAGRILLDLVPTEVAGVRDGVVYVSGRVARRPLAPSPTDGTPVAAFLLDGRYAVHGEVEEFASSGTPALVRGGLLFPTPKAIYRIATGAFDAPAATLWRHAAGGDPYRSADRIGRLVSDGARVWSVTPSRLLLLEPAK